MPAQTPPVTGTQLTALQALGARLRARRAELGISAVAAAESAGMSRATWHRVEGGEPSVTMGAYLSAADTLGLALDLRDPQGAEPRAPFTTQSPLPTAKAAAKSAALLPTDRVPLDRYPQLRRLAWQQPGARELGLEDALALYERNWRHVDPASLEPQERALITELIRRVGGGRLLV